MAWHTENFTAHTPMRLMWITMLLKFLPGVYVAGNNPRPVLLHLLTLLWVAQPPDFGVFLGDAGRLWRAGSLPASSRGFSHRMMNKLSRLWQSVFLVVISMSFSYKGAFLNSVEKFKVGRIAIPQIMCILLLGSKLVLFGQTKISTSAPFLSDQAPDFKRNTHIIHVVLCIS